MSWFNPLCDTPVDDLEVISASPALQQQEVTSQLVVGHTAT